MHCAYNKHIQKRVCYIKRRIYNNVKCIKANTINCDAQITCTTQINQNQNQNWNIHSYSTSRLHLPSSIIRAAFNTIEFNNSLKYNENSNLIVVINSFNSLEDCMLDIINKAVNQDNIWKQKYNMLYNTVDIFASTLLSKSSEEYYLLMKVIYDDFIIIKDILEALYKTRTSDVNLDNIILAYCDVWSANMFMLCCVQVQNKKPLKIKPNIKYIDTRDIIIVEDCNKDIIINKQIENNLYRLIANESAQNIIIVPGKISKTISGRISRLYYCDGDVTTNSYPWDSTAVILGNLLNTTSITLWTDKYRVYTANPEIVVNAKPLIYLTFEDIYNILRFNTVHPSNLNICALMVMYNKSNISININSYDEKIYSTMLLSNNIVSQYYVKCITATHDICIINIYNKDYTFKQRNINLFNTIIHTLNEFNVTILMVCNSFGAVSLSIAINNKHLDIAKEVLENTLTLYTNSCQITYINDCSIINIIGKINKVNLYKSLSYSDKIISIGSSALTESDSANGQYTSVIVKTPYVNDTIINLHNELF